jgi:hypothetical protein
MQGIPTPFPTWGGVMIPNRRVFTRILSLICALLHPRLRVVFGLARLLFLNSDAALALVAHAPPTGSPTDGLRIFCENFFLKIAVKRKIIFSIRSLLLIIQPYRIAYGHWVIFIITEGVGINVINGLLAS